MGFFRNKNGTRAKVGNFGDICSIRSHIFSHMGLSFHRVHRKTHSYHMTFSGCSPTFSNCFCLLKKLKIYRFLETSKIPMILKSIFWHQLINSDKFSITVKKVFKSVRNFLNSSIKVFYKFVCL